MGVALPTSMEAWTRILGRSREAGVLDIRMFFIIRRASFPGGHQMLIDCRDWLSVAVQQSFGVGQTGHSRSFQQV
jgi:hypothetical protein